MANDSQAQVSTNTQMAPANVQVAPATAPATTQMAPATAPATTQMAPATANGMTPPVKKSKKWFDKDCNILKEEVRDAGRGKHNKPHDNLLKVKYHEKLKEFKGKCRSKRFMFWQNKFNEIEASLKDPKMFWKKWKSASELDSQQRKSNITGDQWFSHFSNLHSGECNEVLEDHSHHHNNPQKQAEIEKPFTKKEFMSVIKNLKSGKAVGLDCISNEMLKNSPTIILDLLHKFLNLCLHQSLLPKSWCLEVIIPIFKDGSFDDANNYRGICISSALLKVLCTLLNNRLQSHCTKLGIINKNQIGFKGNHRTSDHLLTLKSVVKKCVTIGKKKLFTCFIDFKKAFDSVWHQGIFHKVANTGFVGKPLDLIENIYKNTKCVIKINNRTTDFFDYTKGVRQGCPLSPILFNIFVNDIFHIMDTDNLSNVSLDEENKVNALMYADDLILLSDTKKGLQKQIDKLLLFCTKWKLEINIKKTKIMIFNRGNKIIKSDFYVNNTLIENVKTFKYLGFTISAKNCSFNHTLEDLSIRANRAIAALNNKIKLSKLPTRLAIKIFNSQIAPILLYGSEVWGPYVDNDYTSWDKNSIERTHTQFLKRILGCNYHTSNVMTRGEVGVRPLIVQVIKRVILYTNNIKKRNLSTVNSAFQFEAQNNISPNFCLFLNKFSIDSNNLLMAKKYEINKKCLENYDRHWLEEINRSPKAISYALFKTSISPETYFTQVKNNKHRIALSRLRLSNHSLMIEKGRHLRPKLERHERKCFLCKNELEDEKHFILKCPLYVEERSLLFQACRKNSIHFDSLNEEQKFIFILTNENFEVTTKLAKYVFNSFKIRDEAITNM